MGDVIESDAGLYKIKAKNTFGEVAASINLNFSPVDAPQFPQVDGTAPTFVTKPSIRQNADDTTTLVFHCSIYADPKPVVTWFHNGDKVQDNKKFQVVTKELDQYTVDCTLLLKNVTVEDAGKYKVTARNDLGESNATISLNFDSEEAPIPKGGVKPTFTERPVIRQSEEESNKIIFECRQVPKIPDGVPPRFPKKPSIKQEGDDLILECILEANPLPEITWFRKDKVIKNDS